MHADIVKAVKAEAGPFKIPVAHALAIVEVESAGKALENGKPLIRWEGHYFFKLTTGEEREWAVRRGLASPKAGGVKNPESQQARYALLERAKLVNKQAALESCSWGLGQIMGSHWKKLRYASVEGFVEAMNTVDGQVNAIFRYCREFGLIGEIQRGDWAAFARAYNGPKYKKNAYDTNLAAAAKRYARGGAKTATVANKKRQAKVETMLRLGAKGPEVKELQRLLARDGFPLVADGDFGEATRLAVRAFQKRHDLEVDGLVGPKTEIALSLLKANPDENLGTTGVAEAVVQTPEGRQGATTAGLGAIFTGAVTPVKDAIEPLTGSGGFVDQLYVGLIAAGLIITLGGIAWTLWGHRKVNTTRGVAA